MADRWMRENRMAITTCVCETPNRDVKALIEGKRLKQSDGTEVKVGGIPHQILTSSSGVEPYPAAYQDRPEGYLKIYTLYAFDFAEIASRAKEYRRVAVAAYGEGGQRAGASALNAGQLLAGSAARQARADSSTSTRSLVAKKR